MFRISNLEFRDYLGFRILKLGFRSKLGFRILKLGFRGHLVFRILCLGFVMAALFYAPDANAGIIGKPPSNLGLVGYWSMNENTGTVAGDSSGNNNRGILTNDPTWVDGKRGKAINFDGSNDYVNAGSGSSLDNLPAITFSAWIYPRAQGTRLFVTNRGNPESSGWRFAFDSATAGSMRFTVDYSTTDLVTRNNSPDANSVAPLNKWTHIAVTWNGSATATNVKIYFNGVGANSYSTANGVGDRVDDNAQNLIIGHNEALTSNGGFNGLIDEVRVYNRALSAAEIQALYKSGAAKINASQNSKLTNGLVGMWSFNGPDLTTTTAYDRSGQGNNGTLGTAGTARIPLRVAGKLGQALDFASGGGDGGSYVDVGSPAILDNLPQVTVSAWIYPRSAGGSTSGGIIINKSDGAIPLNGWRFSLVTSGVDTKILFFNVDYTTTDINVKSVDNTIAFNQWQHVAVSWTGSNNASDVRIYLNGMEVSYKLQTSAVGTRVSDAAQSFGVGDPGTGADFDGLIDEVRIYNRALSAGEVSALYNSGAAKVNASQNSKLTNGLVGMWSFNGPDLTTTTAYDRSGQGNNGTLTNGPTRAIGKIGQALSFDGVDDVVDAGSATNLDNLSAITFSAWILSRSEGEGGTGHIVSKYGTGGTGSGWRLKFGSGTTNALQFNVQYATTDLERYASNNTLQLNVWQHVVVTWDGSASASAARIYVNGAETTYQTTGNPVDARVDDNTNNLRIGNSATTQETFNGLIDDVRVYNRALSPDEVKRLYNMGR